MKRSWMIRALGLIGSRLPLLAMAQPYPDWPVKIVVAFAAGIQPE